jgi:NIMA (never in mitosis gene a)-related kinase
MTTLNPPFKAKDMKTLYKKVIKGQYPDIPYHYSDELRTILSMCLRVSSTARPSADQLLKTKELRSKIRFYECDFGNDENMNSDNIPDKLLQTIRITAEMKNVKLPKSQYQQSRSTKRSHSFEPKKRRENSFCQLNRKGKVFTVDTSRRVDTDKLTLLK